ncbi:MAG: hypothetical protein DMF56_15475 [Acidobacteria bacterium]|nr:MAG: hypothetical protein DMF56_15475 [Acidobacteriota bacterium]
MPRMLRRSLSILAAGGDPHLDTLRANMLIQNGDLGVALADLTTVPEYSEFVRSSAYGRLQ